MKEYIFSRPDEADDTVKRDAYYRGELIRCKDCARNPKDGHARTICPCPMDRYMGDNGYCSKSEPKEADG